MKRFGLVLLLLCLLPSYAAAEITIDTTYGTDGRVKLGEPVRVEVTITNDDEPFSGNLLTTFKESYQLQAAKAYPVELAAGEQMELSFFIRNYQENMTYDNEPPPFILYEGEVQAGRIVDDVKIIEQEPALVNYEAVVIGTYEVDAAYTSLQQLRALTNHEVVIEKLTSTQSDARDYALFDVLIMRDTQALTEQEQQALVEWVKDGGRLVTDAPLTGTVFGQYRALEFAGGASSLEVAQLQQLAKGGTFSNALSVKNVVMKEGAEAWPQQGTPVAARLAVHNGEVIQTAFALNDAALLQANGYSYLFAQVIDLHGFAQKMYWESPHEQIANTLTTNNELFEAFAFSIWKIIAVLGVYIVVVSVVLYIILKKKDKREHAWWLVPAIALVFSLGFFIVGAKDRLLQPQLQEMMLWTVTEDGGTQYFTQSVLANKAGDYTFALQEGVETATYEMYAIPMDRQQLSYRADDVLTVRGVPYWGVKSIVGTREVDAGQIDQQLKIEQQHITGTITNHLPFALDNVQAWSGREFYEIGAIAAGETIDVHVPITHNYLLGATVAEQMMYNERNEELAVIHQNSLLRLANSVFSPSDTPLLIATASEVDVPSQLQQEAKKETKVLIATPLVVTLGEKGVLTLTEEQLQLEIIHEGGYSDWLTSDTKEWYLDRMTYTWKYHLPKALVSETLTWQELAVNNTDERIQLKVFNYETNDYEAIVPAAAKNYVKDGAVMFEVQFVGSEMGSVATLPNVTLKGELK